MALYARSNPVGMDIPIQGFQQFLYNQVKQVWGIQDDFKYACYDRAYRDLIDIGYVPRAIVPNSQGVMEYVNVGLNTDLSWAVSFFHVPDQVKIVTNRTSGVQLALIFMVNLDMIKPSIKDHRADEEARNDIERICYTPRFDLDITSVEIGYETVMREYKGALTTDKSQWKDFHPLHAFRINMTMNYALEDCTGPVPNLL